MKITKKEKIKALEAELEKANEIIEKFRNPLEISISMSEPLEPDPLGRRSSVLYTVSYTQAGLDAVSRELLYKKATQNTHQ